MAASASYVTGTHNIKMGFQNWFGPVDGLHASGTATWR